MAFANYNDWFSSLQPNTDEYGSTYSPNYNSQRGDVLFGGSAMEDYLKTARFGGNTSQDFMKSENILGAVGKGGGSYRVFYKDGTSTDVLPGYLESGYIGRLNTEDGVNGNTYIKPDGTSYVEEGRVKRGSFAQRLGDYISDVPILGNITDAVDRAAYQTGGFTGLAGEYSPFGLEIGTDEQNYKDMTHEVGLLAAAGGGVSALSGVGAGAGGAGGLTAADWAAIAAADIGEGTAAYLQAGTGLMGGAATGGAAAAGYTAPANSAAATAAESAFAVTPEAASAAGANVVPGTATGTSIGSIAGNAGASSTGLTAFQKWALQQGLKLGASALAGGGGGGGAGGGVDGLMSRTPTYSPQQTSSYQPTGNSSPTYINAPQPVNKTSLAELLLKEGSRNKRNPMGLDSIHYA
jgi:hypothetical protein